MEEIEIVRRFHVPNQNDFEVICTYQGKEWRVKVESQVKIRLLIFFEMVKNLTRKASVDDPNMEDWIVREYIRFRSSEGTLHDFMTITTADHTFDSFIYAIQKTQGLGIRNDSFTNLYKEK